jgi:hypothetical protein
MTGGMCDGIGTVITVYAVVIFLIGLGLGWLIFG